MGLVSSGLWLASVRVLRQCRSRSRLRAVAEVPPVSDTHIRRLRAKLGAHAHVLTTVRGHGYRFDPGADVRFRTGVLRRLAN
jgi:hypothetical protein